MLTKATKLSDEWKDRTGDTLERLCPDRVIPLDSYACQVVTEEVRPL
mgnify:CR=1 FL=1